VRLRSYPVLPGLQLFDVCLSAAGQSKQLQSHLDEELGEKVFVVDASERSFWIALRRAEDTSTTVRELVRREGTQSRMGEIVAGFPSTAPNNLPPGPCSFGFHHSNR
jgi:hypothetical protein